MKKILTAVLSLALLSLQFMMPVCAEEKNTPTIEDFVTAITEEAKKYGLEAWVNDYNALGEITEEKIDYAVKLIGEFGETVHTESRENEYLNEKKISSLRASVSRTRSGYFDIVAAPSGAATIKVDINATINTSTNAVTSVNSKSAYQSGIAYFFTSWTTKSITTYMNNPTTGYVKAVVKGDARFDFGPITVNKPNITGSCVIDFR